MKIVALVHGYPEVQNAGAEWMLHEMLKFMVEKGHKVEVLLPISELKPYEFEGVQVNKDTWKYTKGAVESCDLLISHLDKAGRTLNLAEYFHKPFVQVIHNTNYYDILRVKHRDKGNGRFAYVVYNSEYTKKEMKYPNPSVIVHPPVDPKRYRVGKAVNLKVESVGSTEVEVIKPKGMKKGKKLTLINLFARKGSLFFYDLAKLLPDYEFLGVEGGYGKQEKSNLPNVAYQTNTPDMKKVYQQTRILLMPSQYESYGRTAVEAMCSGIPVIAAPTPGLKESLGDAGIFCSLDSPLSWIEAIKKLDDEKEYKKASEKCLERANELKIAVWRELEEMEVFFNGIVNKEI